MISSPQMAKLPRRGVIRAASLGLWGVFGIVAGPRPSMGEPSLGEPSLGEPSLGEPSLGEPEEDARQDDLVARLTGGAATNSARVHLQMPGQFSNGFSVPMTLLVESPMTEFDYVRRVYVLAPQNPIVPVATFHFTPESGRAMVSTRIRLAGPQHVIAVAEMSDGARLKTRAWVDVDTDGCA